MTEPETELEMVQRHVTTGDRIRRDQVELVERLYREGLDARPAEELLRMFEGLQAQHRAHLARIS